MRVVLQRTSYAKVSINHQLHQEIGQGFLLLVGISINDNEQDIVKLANKISGLRIFEDENGKMNKSIDEVQGEILSISQFTLYADCTKGKRPSFDKAAKAEIAKQYYELFNDLLRGHNIKVKEGVFQADMQVELCNEGPVTIILESEQ